MKASEAREKAIKVTDQKAIDNYYAVIKEINFNVECGRLECWYYGTIDPFVKVRLIVEGYTIDEVPDGRNNIDYKITWKEPEPTEVPDMKEHILKSIDDLCMNFFYYDRKNDEELSFDDIQKAYDNGVITIDDIVCRFRNNCLDTLNNKDGEDN